MVDEDQELPVSNPVRTAWEISAAFARNSGQMIDPVHLLYGIMNLEKLPDFHPAESSRLEEAEALEFGALTRAMSQAQISAKTVRRNIRLLVDPQHKTKDSGESSSSIAPINRSAASREAFRQAARYSLRMGQGRICLPALTAALLEAVKDGTTLLATSQQSLSGLITSLLSVRVETPSAYTDLDLSINQPEEMASIVYEALDASQVLPPTVDWEAIGQAFSTLCELSWEAGTGTKIELLFQRSLERLLGAIPQAAYGALLIKNTRSDDLLLKAHSPTGRVSVSTTLAGEAMNQRRAFIWQRGENLSASQQESDLQTGMYAPIIADGEAFGVICLHARNASWRFSSADLFLTSSLGHHIGLVLANRRLREESVFNAKVLERLMTNFSPQVRNRLTQRARAGRLGLGGQSSVVSLICTDIRGFTALAADMETDDIVTMLNDYFTALVNCVFANSGTVDKFIGDSLLAVFGSPESDPSHAENSVKTALEMQAAFREVSAKRSLKGQQTCSIGVGVHTGEVIHGFIGSPDRLEYTVIGTPVNLTSRYCAAAGPGEIIVSSEIYQHLWRKLMVEPVEITLKHEGAATAFRLTGFRK